jgi:hypothetical protein
MDKVVLSLDGSEESRAAVRWCIHNLDPATKVIAVCGISEMEEFVLGVPLFDPTAEQAIEEAFKTRGDESPSQDEYRGWSTPGGGRTRPSPPCR